MGRSMRVFVLMAAVAIAAIGCQKRSEQRSESAGGEIASGMAGAPATHPSRERDSSPRESAVKSSRSLTEEDDGKTVELKVGQVVTVVLDSNRQSGLMWDLAPVTADVMERQGTPAYTEKKAGGTETWRFRATRKGEQTVRLEYPRRMTRSVPERTFRFTAIVN